ncbi:IclR family transcriptional regulator [Kocuria dechangensis]|uniref:Glycerol operon regulatory protein n=1 Tax=Kocuria dechangensis TaxID=1176249 RepID=A0A917H3P9_9MICC|nr:IclR family transcriptional regulator [Kocuria dechangensis]GGG66412.1 IclR family transcriptional regulator [Kocuria dechangensis]
MTEKSGTVGKALGLLTMLGEYPQGATAGQIAEAAGYPFSTAYRLLNTLVKTGFAAYDPQEKHYRLGLRIYQLGQKVAHHRGFEGAARPALQHLTESTGESSILAVLDDDQFLTVHKVDGPQFRITTDPGDRGPLHTSSLGKVLLAYAEPATREHLLASIDLVPRTEHSITDRDELRRQIDEVRQQGWAGQSEENDVGMAAVAVPVLSASHRLIAAVSLAAPLFRTDLEGLQHHLPELRRAAATLALELPIRT